MMNDLIRPKSQRSTRILSGSVVGAVIVLGVVLYSVSRAATPYVSTEAESGTAVCAGRVADTTASGGAAVAFTSCGGGGSAPIGLDDSGTKIPDTNYAAPAGAIYMSTAGNDANTGTQALPVKTLDRAVALVPVDGTIVLRGGVYRDSYKGGGASFKIATKSMTLQAFPHEQVWFDGTDVIPATNWASDGAGHWYMAWATPTFCDGKYYDFPYNNQSKSPSNLTGASGATYVSNNGPCTHWDQYGSSAANFPAAGDPQMVFVNGVQMTEVPTLAEATGGKFFYDWAAKRMYISTNPGSGTIELAARPVALVGGGATSQYTFKGIGFRRYATNEYENLTNAAVYIGGKGYALFENTVFTENAGKGLGVKPLNSVVRSSVFAANGFNGLGAYGSNGSGGTDNIVLETSVFNNNNTEKFGLNCSISCAAAGVKTAFLNGYTIRGNIFKNGQGKAAGFWCDTKCNGGKIIGNLVQDNGGSGIDEEMNSNALIASNLVINNNYGINVGAANAKIFNNTVVNSRTIALRIYDDSRPEVTSGIEVLNNIVSGKSVNDNWFANNGGSTGPSSFITGFDYNSYWRPTAFTLYRWIDSATSDRYFSSTALFRAALPKWESHAQDVVGTTDPYFTNPTINDYRVRTNSQAYNSGAALPADVAAALGVASGVVTSRGALSWPGKL